MHWASQLQKSPGLTNGPPLFDTISPLVPIPFEHASTLVTWYLFLFTWFCFYLPIWISSSWGKLCNWHFIAPQGQILHLLNLNITVLDSTTLANPLKEIFVILILSFSTTLFLPAWRSFIKLPPTSFPRQIWWWWWTMGQAPPSSGVLALIANQVGKIKAQPDPSPVRPQPCLPLSPQRRRYRRSNGLGYRPDHNLNLTFSTYLLCTFCQWDCLHFPAAEFLFFRYIETIIPISRVVVRIGHSDKASSTMPGIWWIHLLCAFKTKQTNNSDRPNLGVREENETQLFHSLF